MSYLTGTTGNFENRLHARPTGIADVALYILEANSYLSGPLLYYTSGHWHKEFIKKYQIYQLNTTAELLAAIPQAQTFPISGAAYI
jgi:hypothetical protein